LAHLGEGAPGGRLDKPACGGSSVGRQGDSTVAGATWSRHDAGSRGGQDAGLVLILLFLTAFAVWWSGSTVNSIELAAKQDRQAWCQAHPYEVEIWKPYDADPCFRAWELR
jgi:hypothetical protein